MSDRFEMPTTPAIPADLQTSIPDGWWDRLDAELERDDAELNEAIRREAERLRAEMDPAELERLVQLGMKVFRRVREKYRPR